MRILEVPMLHIQIYTHTSTLMKAHIYIQYDSQPYHAVTHADSRVWTLMLLDIFRSLHPVKQLQWVFRTDPSSVFYTVQQKHRLLRPKSHRKEERKKTDKGVSDCFLVSGCWFRIQCTGQTYCKVVTCFFFFSVFEHIQHKKVFFKFVMYENQIWLTIYSRYSVVSSPWLVAKTQNVTITLQKDISRYQ